MEKRARNVGSGKKPPPRAVLTLELERTLPRHVGPYVFCGDCGLADGQHFEDCRSAIGTEARGVAPTGETPGHRKVTADLDADRSRSPPPLVKGSLQVGRGFPNARAAARLEISRPVREAHEHPARKARELGLRELEEKLRRQGFALMVPTARRARLHIAASSWGWTSAPARTACGRVAPQQTIEVHAAWLCRGCAMVLGRVALAALALAFVWTPRADSDARHATYHVWIDRVLEAYR